MVVVKDLIQIDAKEYADADAYIRFSLLFSMIGQKPVQISNLRSGLTATQITLIQSCAQATQAKLLDVIEDSTTFSFIPIQEFSAKKIVLQFESSYSLFNAFMLFYYPALLTCKKTSIQLKGMTHIPKKTSVCFLKEEFMRYLHKYMSFENYLQLSCGFAPFDNSGELDVTFQGKFPLFEFVPFKPKIHRNLIVVRGELLVGQDMSDDLVEHTKQILELSLRQSKLEYRLVETKVSTAKGISLQLFGYFGTELGFDNDFPFVVGKEHLWNSDSDFDIVVMERNVLKFLKEFNELITIPAFDKYIVGHMVPLLVLAGGEIPVQELTDELLIALFLAKTILGVQYAISENMISVSAYDGISEEDILRIDDL